MQFAKILAALCLCAGLACADPIALKQHCEVRSEPVFSRGGQYLLVGAGTSKSAVWNLWDVPKGQLLRSFSAPAAAGASGIKPVSASFAADGKTFALLFTYWDLGSVRVQVWRQGQVLYDQPGKGLEAYPFISLSPDGSLLLLSGWDLADKPGRDSSRVVTVADPKRYRNLKKAFSRWTDDNQMVVAYPETLIEEPWSGKIRQSTPLEAKKYGDKKNSGKSGWPYLGKTDLGLRFEKLMGKGRADLFEQSSGKVLASWPRLWGLVLDPKEKIQAVVTDEGVVLIDLKASQQAHALKTL